MSRYNPHRDVEPIFKIVQEWKEKCLLSGGSLFTKKEIWQSEYIEELVKYYIDNLAEGSGTFYEKLESQLRNASSEAKLLAAEIMYVMLLAPSNIKPEKKRENLRVIWKWTNEPEPASDHHLLQDAVLKGIGSGGVGYNNFRWKEFVFAIQVFKGLFELSQTERKALLNDGWEFANWLEQIPDIHSRQFRHMLLHVLYPDQFDRIFGGVDRTSILSIFMNESRQNVWDKTAFEMDKALSEVREKAAQEYGTDKLDFYESPLKEVWKAGDSKDWLFCRGRKFD